MLARSKIARRVPDIQRWRGDQGERIKDTILPLTLARVDSQLTGPIRPIGPIGPIVERYVADELSESSRPVARKSSVAWITSRLDGRRPCKARTLRKPTAP